MTCQGCHCNVRVLQALSLCLNFCIGGLNRLACQPHAHKLYAASTEGQSDDSLHVGVTNLGIRRHFMT